MHNFTNWKTSISRIPFTVEYLCTSKSFHDLSMLYPVCLLVALFPVHLSFFHLLFIFLSLSFKVPFISCIYVFSFMSVDLCSLLRDVLSFRSFLLATPKRILYTVSGNGMQAHGPYISQKMNRTALSNVFIGNLALRICSLASPPTK